MSDPRYPGVQDVERAEGLPFLSRWSRRKLGREEAPDDLAPVVEPVTALEPVPAAEPEEPIDARTGKLISELTDEDMPDLESLDANSDISMFMAGQVSNALRMKALTKVFHTSKFNQICLCAEYAEDYTNFVPLGDIVPHDLKQAIAREAGKLYERLTEKGLKITPDEAEARIAAEFRSERLPDLEAELVARGRVIDDQGEDRHGESPVGADEQLHPARALPRGNTEAT